MCLVSNVFFLTEQSEETIHQNSAGDIFVKNVTACNEKKTPPEIVKKII